MTHYCIAMGSNIDPNKHAPKALQGVAELGDIDTMSSIYETAAIERPDDPAYWNAIICLETKTRPGPLRDKLRAIEAELGRVRTEDKFAARTMDLDILQINGEAPPDSAAEIEERAWLAWALKDIGHPTSLRGERPATVFCADWHL